MGGVKTRQKLVSRGAPGGRAWEGQRHRRSDAWPRPGGAQSRPWRRSEPGKQDDNEWGLLCCASHPRMEEESAGHKQMKTTYMLWTLFRGVAGVCDRPFGATGRSGLHLPVPVCPPPWTLVSARCLVSVRLRTLCFPAFGLLSELPGAPSRFPRGVPPSHRVGSFSLSVTDGGTHREPLPLTTSL